MKNYVLIACCSTKLPYAASAEQLYQSQLFKKSLAYARALNPDGIFILSALHHLVTLDKRLEPYNVCLKDYSSSERKEWAEIVCSQLSEVVEIDDSNFVILAGKDYYTNLISHMPHYTLPMEEMKIGERLSWLSKELPKEN